MDIIKAFQTNMHITIKATYNEPLLEQVIGEILEISKIRNFIIDFDHTENVALIMGTHGKYFFLLKRYGLVHCPFTNPDRFESKACISISRGVFTL